MEDLFLEDVFIYIVEDFGLIFLEDVLFIGFESVGTTDDVEFVGLVVVVIVRLGRAVYFLDRFISNFVWV